MGTDRTASLASEFERIAAELRAGEATLSGYEVQREPVEHERGGIDYSGGWLVFELDHPDGWFDVEE